MSNHNIPRAEIATVQIGHLEFEGLYCADLEQFGIAVPQICSLFLFPTKHSSRDIKTILGDDFQFSKWRTSLNPKAVNIIQLLDFEKLIRKLDRKGNITAQKITDELIGLSLHQLFSDAFCIKFDKEDRQEFLKARQSGKRVRRTLTDAIKEYLITNAISGNEANFMYANVTDVINSGVFGRRAKQLKLDWQCTNPRDAMTPDELRLVEEAENLTMRLIDYDHLTPLTASKEAIKRLCFRIQTR